MRTVAVVLAAGAFAACSSEVEGTGGEALNACITPGDAYRYAYRELSGTCGPVQDQTSLTRKDGAGPMPDGCVAGPNARSEGCDVFMDYTCSLKLADSTPVTMTIAGKATWQADGTRGLGSVTLSIQTPGLACTSTYEISATRL